MKNKSPFRLQYAILAICAVVFVVCAILLVKTLNGYSRANSFYGDITLDMQTGEDEPSEDEEIPVRIRSLMESYRDIKKEYPNVVGYIHIPAISISYPVVQGTDNTYYTTHLISGEENRSGSIFLDFCVDPSPSRAKNLILYGHNMNDKSMFHPIRELFTEETFRKTQVEYICDEGVFIYESLSICLTDIEDPYYAYSFSDDAAFATFVQERAAKSRFPVEYETPSNLITLVTCSNAAGKPDQRLVYHASLVKIYTDFGESYE
ncbi:MAG: class B sortase [Ruminococcaceae bacterium]|nr:class B sortase [Oscillospiraceae bacterium]